MVRRRALHSLLTVLLGAFLWSAQTDRCDADVSIALNGGQLTWQIDGKPLGASPQWLQICDLAAGNVFVPVPTTSQNGIFRGTVAGLALEGQWKPVGKALELACTVTAQPPEDRAIVVRIALPLNAVGWTWWDDIFRKRPIEPGKNYTYVLKWGGLREVSTYPLCAVTGPPGGVTAATPLHELRVHRLAYDTDRQALEAEFDLGLSPDAAKLPCRADFHLVVYDHDPKWGFRDALRRYYGIFPQYAERRVGEGGIWILRLVPEKMACPWDWAMRFDEGGEPHAGYDCAHDILPFVYTEPFGKYENMGKRPTPDGKSLWGERAFPMTKEELKQSVLDRANKQVDPNDKRAAMDKEWAQAEVNSAIENQDGSWVWRHWTDIWSSGGTWISNITLNDDPNLPPPSRASCTWKLELDRGAETARRDGGELRGVYLDSVCGFMGFYNENFRREHWRYTDQPLVASRKAKQPVQLHASTCFALGVQIAQKMHEQGNFTMGNTGRPEMAWFCPILDMIGTGEWGIGLQADEHYAYMRAYGYHKPMSPMAYDLVNPEKSWEEKEQAFHRMLYYAVHGGTGGFDAPLKYEPSRPLYRYYQPIICWIDQAGWQPVTGAAVSDPSLLIERYGPGEKELSDVVFLAVRNPGKAPAQASIEVDTQSLPEALRSGQGQPIAWLMVADTPAELKRAETGAWTVSGVPIRQDGTEVVAIGQRNAIARLWLRQAQQWLDRMAREAAWLGSKQAAVVRDGDFEQGLGGWGLAVPPNNARAAEIVLEEQKPLSGKRCARIQSQGDISRHGLNCGLQLTAGEEHVLRFKYSWTRPDGANGTFVPRFGVKGPDGAWASDKYVCFRDLQPTGDQTATCERRFSLPPGYSTGFFQFLFEGNWGTVRIDDVEITSQGIQAAQERTAKLTADARAAADAFQQDLASAQDLAALVAQQRPIYEKLRDSAQSLSDSHTRRCLLMPAQNFAECLGRATEVATGITVHQPRSAFFADVARRTEVALACKLHAGPSAVEDLRLGAEGGPALAQGIALNANEERTAEVQVKIASTSPWDWEDALIHADFRCNGKPVWLPRRVTLRLHIGAEVEPAGPLGSIGDRLRLRLRTWLPAPVQLSATIKVGEQTLDIPALRVDAKPGEFTEAAFVLPAAAVARLDELAQRGEKILVTWRAEAQGFEPVAGRTEVPLVRAVRCPPLAQPPKLDGKIESAEWAQAAKLDGFGNASDGKPAVRPTTVLLGHDGQRLYIACACGGQKKPVAQDRGQDGEVWKDDAIEVFLQPPGSESYYHLAVNAVGSRLDERCGGGHDTAWTASWEAKAGPDADGWSVEMAIPLDAFGAKAEGTWRVNIGREEADTQCATCWSPTFGGFHTPARFGELCF